MPSAAERAPDPGLAPQRTALTWQRMALGFISIGALVIGLAARRQALWMLVPAGALLGAGAVLWRYGRARARGAGGPSHDHRTAARRLAAATLATAVLAALLAVVPAR
ncbi:MAG: hypothetical protein QOD55_955 [Solirubrobacteraceae bacterium]|jgi:uncharacterized membrane protein YidH (DUF202 family)|nr:hypothetical protein [Solirubrobacteraceae bacterium]MEA2288958.1 hypothetical protein [Solirubrobacteraceae bacterium]